MDSYWSSDLLFISVVDGRILPQDNMEDAPEYLIIKCLVK